MAYRLRKWPKAISQLEPIHEIGDAPGFEYGVDYCGVTAMASITGLHCKFLTQTVQKMRGSAGLVVGITPQEIVSVLGYIGYRVDWFDMRPDDGERITVQNFYRTRDAEQPAVIAVLAKHVLALDWALVCDTSTSGKAEHTDDYYYNRYSVHQYLEVRKVK